VSWSFWYRCYVCYSAKSKYLWCTRSFPSILRKDAKDLDLAESAYIASIPKAPTHYSPYGKYKADLDARKILF